MIASQGYHLTPPEIARRLRQVAAFEGPLLTRPERIPEALPKLQYGGTLHYRTIPADINVITQEIATYRATIIEVKRNPNGPMPDQNNQHFLVLTAISEYEAIVIDPLDGEEKKLADTPYTKNYWGPARAIYGLRRVRLPTVPEPP